MRFSNRITATALLLLLPANAGRAATNGFVCQSITLPCQACVTRFVDLGNGGRADLLAVDPVRMELWIYRQRPYGFTNTPDQVIALPPQTAWVAASDVDAHPGLELVMSTAAGLVYYRQNNGVFETQPRTLVQASQVFTNTDSPSLISLGTNAAIPVITATHAELYQHDGAFEWSHGQPLPIEVRRNTWFGERNGWTMGPNSSRSLRIQQYLSANPVTDDKPENDTIRKLLEETKKTVRWFGTQRLDLNGDGQKDFVLWRVISDRLYPKTDLYVFLRGADGRLPEQPTQVLHCSGFPIPIGSTDTPSAIGHLKGDDSYQLVLLELKSTLISASSLVEMLVSRGLNWELTIRSCHNGAFSRSPDATVPLKGILLSEESKRWPLFICGDFNGDGRPDFVIQRSITQWHILFSTQDKRWFTSQPSMTFETELRGDFEVSDLNGDGRSDLVLRAQDEPRMLVFLSTLGSDGAEAGTQAPHRKGKHP